MKNTLRIPTDMYAYIEVEYVGTPEEAIEEYKRLTQLVKGGAGMPRKDFTAILDAVLSKGTRPMTPDEWESMSPEQQNIFGEIKNSWKRTGFDLPFLLKRQEEHNKN